MKLLKVKKIQFQKFIDKRGNLSVVEELKDIPFEIKRSYWIYDIPAGKCRGGHAYYKNEEVVIAMSGSFDLILKDGVSETVYHLNRSDEGIFIPAGIWREMKNFSTNAQIFLLASTKYNPDDYIWDINQFKEGK